LAEVPKELLTLIVDELKDSGIFLAVTEGFHGYLDVWFWYRCHGLLALLCAFDLALLLKHVFGWLLARTRSGTDVVPHSTLGHGTIRSFDHFSFHGLLSLSCFLRHTAHLDLDLDIAFTFALAFTLHLFVAAAT
jgi:hypothetical protein